MALKTQGSELWFLDPENNQAVKVGCVQTLTGITAARDQIEVTCLDSEGREYEPGMPTPGAAQFTISFDPADASHVRLHELYKEGTKVDWALGFSDGTAVPDVDSNGFDLSESRSWITFNAYISDLPFDFAINTVVTSNLSLQISGFPDVVPKA